MKTMWRGCAAMALVLAAGAPAMAWWDTVVKNWQFPPLVESLEAEALPGAAAAVRDDALASGGKAVEMALGGASLTITRELTHGSTYALFIVGRSPREAETLDPGSMKPFYFHVTVTDPTGTVTTHRLRAAYQHEYVLNRGPEDMARCYFVAPQAGTYQLKLSVGERTTAGALWVDRLDLRDVLGNAARRAGKTGRTMISDDELRNLRGGELKPAPRVDPQRAAARVAAYWDSFPPLNAPRQGSANPAHVREKRDDLPPADFRAGWTMNALDQPWAVEHAALKARYTAAEFAAHQPLPGPLPDDGWGVTFEGLTNNWAPHDPANGTFGILGGLFQERLTNLVTLMLRKAAEYEKTGNEEAGLEAAAIMTAFAYHYPALDYRSQASWLSNFSRFHFTSHIGGGMVISGQLQGHAVRDYVKAYDQIFDFILANRESFTQFVATRVPAVRTPDDLIAFLDTNILQRTADAIIRGDAQGDSLKMSLAMALTILSQGVNDISQKWVDVLMTNIPMGLSEPGSLEDLAYGDLGRDGLVSKGSGGYSKGSIMSLLEVAMLLRDYRAQGGKVAVDLTDFGRPRGYPWFRDALYAPINLRVAGGWVPLLGDYGDPLRVREVFFDTGPTRPNGSKAYYLDSWRLTGDPAFAFLAARYGRSVESDEEWGRITAAAKTVRDPLNTLPPRALDDLGLAILETGQHTDDFTRKNAITLRYGIGQNHGHNDGLDLAVWGKGMRAITDLAARDGSPNPRLHKMHNTVEVDRRTMNNEDATIPGYGWLNALATFGDVQYTDASQRAVSHPELTEYRRGAALIGVGEDDAYVFNVFRVAGGTTHTWAAHANQNDAFDINAPLTPAQSPEALSYLKGFKTPDTTIDEKTWGMPALFPQPAAGKVPANMVATWRLHPRAEDAFLGKKLDEGNKVHARWRLFGREGDDLFVANGTSARYRYDMTFLYAQRTNVGPEGSVYPSLAEVYQGNPVVQAARELTVEDAGAGAARAVAVEVTLPDGRIDLCMAGVADGKARKVEGGFTFDGRFAFVSRDAQGVRKAVLIGGTRLTGPGVDLSLPTPAVVGTVAAIEPADNACVVHGDFRGVDLTGRIVRFVVNEQGRSYAFTVTAQQRVEGGVRLTLKERMRIFQSAVDRVDGDAGSVATVAEAYNLKADKTSYHHTLATNEAGDKRWRANIVCDVRWMIVKTPVAEADIPDTNGDGRRLLSLMGTKTDGDMNGKPRVELEVIRVDEASRTIYFKMPPSPFDLGGWDYVSRPLVSESGRQWTGTYPGFQYQVVLDGKVADSDFTDPNEDGRRLLALYRFAPGAKLVAENTAVFERP